MKSLITLLAVILFSSSLFAAELSSPTLKLNGTNITYNYTSGRSYIVKFEEKGVSYRYLTGSKPEKWWGPFPYKAFETSTNEFLASWFEKDFGDYVTLLVNFNNNLLYGSAIISGKTVHFHGANIIKVSRG